MNQFFNKYFWKYFILGFVITLLFSSITIAYKQLEYVLNWGFTSKYVVQHTFYSIAVVFTFALSVGATLATFIVFRRTTWLGIPSFFKMLAIGCLFILPISIGIYFYNDSVKPRATYKVMEQYYNVKMYSLTPEHI